MHYEYSSYCDFRCFACNIRFGNFDDQKKHYFAYHVNQTSNVSRPPASSYKPKTLIRKPVSISLKCDICDVSCTSKIVYDLHMKGKKHLKTVNKINLMAQLMPQSNSLIDANNTSNNIESLSVKEIDMKEVQIPSDFFCRDCSVGCSTAEQLQKHLSGAKHIKVLKMKNYAERKEKKDPSVYCEICDLYLLDDLMKTHREGGKHKRKCTEKSPNEPEGKKAKVRNEIITTVEYCGHCEINLKSSAEAVEHYQSRHHLQNVSKSRRNSDFKCDTCRSFFTNQTYLDTHLKGFKHYAKLNRNNQNPEGDFAPKLLKMREKSRNVNFKHNGPRFNYQNKPKSDSEPANMDEVVFSAVTEVVNDDEPAN